MVEPYQDTSKDLLAFGLGWLIGIAIWALILSAALAHLNEVSGGELLALWFFWTAVYGVLSIPAALVAGWLGARTRTRVPHRSTFSAVSLGVATAAAFVACLMLLSRWTPAWQAVTPVSLRLLPIGAFDLIALAIGFLALVTGATHVARAKKSEVISGGAWIAAALLVLGGTHAINRTYEIPSRVDVRKRVAPLIEHAQCDATDAPVSGLVFLAIDGFSWNVAAPLLEEGKLPNLRALLSQSAYGQLDTLYPSYSPVVWATVATGLTEDEHRVHGFLQFRFPGVSTPIARGPLLNSFMWWGGANSILGQILTRLKLVHQEPLPSTRRRGHTIWNVAGANGLSVGVYDWMNSWPIEPVEGYAFTSNGRAPQNSYPSEAVLEVVNKVVIDGSSNRPPVIEDGLRHFEEAFELFRVFEPEVSFHFNKVIDLSHDLWADPQGYFVWPLERPYSEFVPEIRSAYELTDAWIGRFREALPSGYAFAIVSDHGYEFNGAHHVYQPPGVVILSGGPFACGRVIEGATVYDIAPTLLAVLGLPGTAAMSGHVLRESFATPSTAPDLERLPEYPPDWRKPYESDPATGEDWEELMERLRAMGYVN